MIVVNISGEHDGGNQDSPVAIVANDNDDSGASVHLCMLLWWEVVERWCLQHSSSMSSCVLWWRSPSLLCMHAGEKSAKLVSRT